MPDSEIGILFILVLMLPGFLVHRFVDSQRADPTQRSTVWEISQMVQYSTYIHIQGIGMLALILWILSRFFEPDLLTRILDSGLAEFVRTSPVIASGIGAGYVGYIIVTASLFGAYNVPKRFEDFLISIPGRFFTPNNAIPPEPVWFRAFNSLTDNYRLSQPYLLVNMKGGACYFGALGSYGIVADHETSNDFMLTDTIYYPSGIDGDSYELNDTDEVGAVLLNTSNVESIHIYYHPRADNL